MEHFYVKFGDPSCIGCRNIMWGKRQTNTHTQTELTDLPLDCRRRG